MSSNSSASLLPRSRCCCDREDFYSIFPRCGIRIINCDKIAFPRKTRVFTNYLPRDVVLSCSSYAEIRKNRSRFCFFSGSSAARTPNICRMRSIEGADRAPGHQQQTRLEVFDERFHSTEEASQLNGLRLEEAQKLHEPRLEEAQQMDEGRTEEEAQQLDERRTEETQQLDGRWIEQAQQLDEGRIEEAQQLDDRTLSSLLSGRASLSNDKEISEEGNQYNQNCRNIPNTSVYLPKHGQDEKEEETTPTEKQEDEIQEEDRDEETVYVTKFSVPRQKYIHVPKVDLVNALLLLFFPANKDASKFLSICSYLELILHAEHKVVLEELRLDYNLTQYVAKDGNMPGSSRVHKASAETNTTRLGSTDAEAHAQLGQASEWPAEPSEQTMDHQSKGIKEPPWKILADAGVKLMSAFTQEHEESGDTSDAVDVRAREAAAARFQRNFLKMLRDAEFEGISVRDLELTAALNSDYLLALPVDVDWKRAASSNVIIFRRGYTKEEQKGLLLGEKFDYLQSLLLRKIFNGFTGPLLHAGRWCLKKWSSLWEDEEGRAVAESLSRWLQEPLWPKKKNSTQSSNMNTGVPETETESDLPLWMAAQQAIPRYEAVITSAGSRGKLLRGILVRMGLLPSESIPVNLSNDEYESAREPHLRPNYLSRVSMKDIWLPASTAVAGRNIWKRLSAAFSVFFSKATLREPAFQELVLLYNGDGQGESEGTGLRLQTYKRIPIPELKIVFPSKKLTYRVLDTVRLDITSLAGLLAFTVNYRFDDLSSPSAFLLDLIATSALIVFISRAAFGYKQAWDRYQLLVNKTLYEKTVASGFGVVHFLLDESEDQQFKEAVLVFMLLMHEGNTEGMTTTQLKDACERFLYYRCKAQVEMPIERALETLVKLGLVVGSEEVSDVRFRALPFEQGLAALLQHWVSLPSNMPLSN